MKELDYGKGYQYAHNTEKKLTHMQCMPDSLKDREYYRPTIQGEEEKAARRLAEIKAWKKAGEGRSFEDREHQNKSAEGRFSLYDSYFGRLFVFGNYLWDLYEYFRVQLSLSHGYEPFYLCRLYGVCGGQYAAGSLSSFAGLSYDFDGKRQTFVLRPVHAGAI